MNEVLAAALAAHDAGLCVVRAKDDGTKRPDGRWKQYQSMRPQRDELVTWFGSGWGGLGLVCGTVSGGLEMLELEGRAVAEGLADELDRLAEEAGLFDLLERITAGYCERTPSDGIHLLYRCSEVEGNLKLARDEKLEVLIETRGEGGFVIVAPSNGTTHPTGGAWELVDGGFDRIATITPEERTALLDLCRRLDRSGGSDFVPSNEGPKPVPPPSDFLSTSDDTRPGDEFNDAHTCHDVLLAVGFVEHSTDAKGVHYTRPGKDPRKGSSASVWADNGRCTLFSSSIGAPTEYLDERRNLSPWQAHFALNFDGDYSAAARQWRQDHPRTAPTSQLAKQEPQRVVDHNPALYLPDAFWEARPVLVHIRQAARSRMTSPDGVLNAVLGRVAAFTPHTVDLPPIIAKALGLTYYGANIGPSEAGKSAGSGVARELIPHAPPGCLDMLPLGSGEGYVEALFEYDAEEKQKVQRWYGAYFYVDEGAVLGDLSSRSGSTLLATLRSAYSHQTLGATNASKERKRVLQGTEYVYGITLGIQPELAGPFLADATAGTPQRFVYLRADDPTMTVDPIDWPGRLEWERFDAGTLEDHAVSDSGWTRHRLHVAPGIRSEVRADRVEAQKNPRPTLDAHRTLVRLKVAALLAILDGRMDVTDEDWGLASVVSEVSRAVRQGIEATLSDVSRMAEDARTAAHVRRELTVEAGLDERAMEVMVKAIAKHVERHALTDGCPKQCVRDATPSKYRPHAPIDLAIAKAIELRWIVESDGHYQIGQAGLR